ncbi:hypothetical protein ACVRY7_05120 [Streptococcus ictaluri]|uniref:Uncharacterized protein n=1 Tax=Streptococcus ictaluri 707-05 TaxID=764299 RepID=G5K5A0_9STRE|nr:hypothetical protein [Streptococcus ictaluri]EHI69074.1 hypothetical protein STRIC_1994 [Streptococcus ictaluri 707-05]
MKQFLKDTNWIQIGLVLALSFLLMMASDLLGYLFIPEISESNPYWYTFMSYFNFISMWAGVLLVVYSFPSEHFMKKAIVKNSKGNTYALLLWGALF